jgi:hypothetical protein
MLNPPKKEKVVTDAAVNTYRGVTDALERKRLDSERALKK